MYDEGIQIALKNFGEWGWGSACASTNNLSVDDWLDEEQGHAGHVRGLPA